MIPREIANLLEEISEEKIREAASMIDGDNNFKQLLVSGDVFRMAGLQPIYLTTPDHMAITVSSKETFNKKLH